MTVLINGSVHLPAGDREKALAETAELVAETRAQKGCRHYVWSVDPASDTRLHVYENWDSVADLAAHLAGPCYQNMLAALVKYGVYDVAISKFRVDLEEPVYDPEGRPRADFFTG